MVLSFNCTVCLGNLDLQNDKVHGTNCGHCFHLVCLTQSLKSSTSCPQCRRPNIQHFQMFFEVHTENDDYAEGAVGGVSDVSSQIEKIMKKLDNISSNMNKSGGVSDTERRDNKIYRDLIGRLQRENDDLKEILEMEKIISSNSEREIDRLKVEVRERNDIINSLQVQVDILKEEAQLYGLPSSDELSSMKTANLHF